MRKIIIIILFFLTSLSAEVKDKAPDFNLYDLNKKVHRLSKLKGKIVVLNFFATWCPPCRKELPGFVKIAKKYKDKNVQFLGVHLGQRISIKDLKKFVKEQRINYPVLQGDKNIVIKYGGIRAIPTTFFINEKGIIYKRHVGYLGMKELKEVIEKMKKINKTKKEKTKKGK